jgi:hypothetical protein
MIVDWIQVCGTDDCGLDPSASGQSFCEHDNELSVSIITCSAERIAAFKEGLTEEVRIEFDALDLYLGSAWLTLVQGTSTDRNVL